MKICPSCNHKNPPVVNACTACGANLSIPSPEKMPAEQPVVQQPVVQQPVAGDVSDKSKITAGILGIIFGALGIHNFYIGNTGKGLAQLLITVLTLGIAGIFIWVWAVIESVGILQGNATDGNGRKIIN